MISTAVAGSAVFTRLPAALFSARTRPEVRPTLTTSPTFERAGLDEHGCDVAAALVDLRLDDRADRVAVRVRLEVLEVGDEEDHLHQVVDPGSLLRADRPRR